MTDAPPERPALDEDTIAFAGRVFQSARLGHAPELAELLAAGLPANLTNDKGDTLLMLAAYHGHVAAVRALMEHGADPGRANDRGQVPLTAAAFKGYGAVIEAMLDAGAPVDGAGPDGRTALMMAAMFDRTEMVDLLVARGADAAARDAAGLGAADLAERMGAAGAAPRRAKGCRGRTEGGRVKVSDVMSTAVEFIGGNAPVKEAAELMGELDVGALPVGNPGALEGIVTDRDLLFRVVAAGLDPNATLVRDVASRALISCRENDALQVAMDLMAANHVRRLPVVDDRGEVTGWVTLADISRKLLVDSRGLQDALSAITEPDREAG